MAESISRLIKDKKIFCFDSNMKIINNLVQCKAICKCSCSFFSSRNKFIFNIISILLDFRGIFIIKAHRKCMVINKNSKPFFKECIKFSMYFKEYIFFHSLHKRNKVVTEPKLGFVKVFFFFFYKNLLFNLLF